MAERKPEWPKAGDPTIATIAAVDCGAFSSEILQKNRQIIVTHASSTGNSGFF